MRIEGVPDGDAIKSYALVALANLSAHKDFLKSCSIKDPGDYNNLASQSQKQ